MMKIGLCLGGGGAKGSYQIGIFKALEEANLLSKVTHVSGTSIGAINAALLMSRKNHEKQVEIWRQFTKENIFSKKRKDHKGLYSVLPMYEKILQFVDKSEVVNSKLEGYVIGAYLENKDNMIGQLNKFKMKQKIFHLNEQENPFDAIVASASIPLLFGYKEIENSKYVDGGILNNHPIEPLISQGCKFIINIPIDRFFKKNNKLKNQVITIWDLGAEADFRMLYLRDLADAVKFDNKSINRRYLYGYLVGKHMIKLAYENNIIDNNNNFVINDSFSHIKINKKEDKLILRQVKLMIKEGYSYI